MAVNISTAEIVAPAPFEPDWPAIIAVVLAVTAFSVAQGLTYPLISLVLESRHVSAAVNGLNAGMFSIGVASSTLLIARLTARIRGDRLIVASLIGCALCAIVFTLSDALWIWFLARFLLGFFASVIFILSEAWLNAACPDHLRGRISGMYGAGMCSGFAAGPLAIPLFGIEGHGPFLLLATYLTAVAIFTALISRQTRTRPEESPPGGILKFVIGAPALIAMVMAFGFGDITAISGMPVYFARMGYSESFAAFSVTILALPTAIAQPFVGILLDRLPRMGVAIGACAVAAASYLLIPMLESNIAILIVFAVLGAASFGLYTCALTILGGNYSGGLLVAGSAAYALAYAAGSAGGSVTSGFVMETFAPAAMPIGTGLVLLVFTAIIALARK